MYTFHLCFCNFIGGVVVIDDYVTVWYINTLRSYWRTNKHLVNSRTKVIYDVWLFPLRQSLNKTKLFLICIAPLKLFFSSYDFRF